MLIAVYIPSARTIKEGKKGDVKWLIVDKNMFLSAVFWQTRKQQWIYPFLEND